MRLTSVGNYNIVYAMYGFLFTLNRWIQGRNRLFQGIALFIPLVKYPECTPSIYYSTYYIDPKIQDELKHSSRQMFNQKYKNPGYVKLSFYQ